MLRYQCPNHRHERILKPMLVNRRTLRIEWGQCDPAGIVFYPQYLLIFDTSTGWLFERTGLKPLAMREKYGIVGMPIVEVGARFVMPCRFDDEVVVESEIKRVGTHQLYGAPPRVEGRPAGGGRF